MKTAFCDTLKNGQFWYNFIPQKSLDLIEYIWFVDEMETLSFQSIFWIIELSTTSLWDKGIPYQLSNFYLIEFWHHLSSACKILFTLKDLKSKQLDTWNQGKCSLSSENLTNWFLLPLLKWLIFSIKVNFPIFYELLQALHLLWVEAYHWNFYISKVSCTC